MATVDLSHEIYRTPRHARVSTMAKRAARSGDEAGINGPAHATPGRGRPKKHRPDDGRLTYQHPSALARAADHACLTLLARSELDPPTLSRADQYARRSVHWGDAQSTMLHKSIPAPQLPPPPRKGDSTTEWVRNLKRWAVTHTRTRTLKGQERCFKMSDALYRPTPPHTTGRVDYHGAGEEGVDDDAMGGSDEWIQCVLCCRWHVVPPKYGPASVLRADFRCGDVVWLTGIEPVCLPSPGAFEPKAWDVMERWLRDLSLRRWNLTFDETIGFGLIATDTFRKGDIVTHGTLVLPAHTTAPTPLPPSLPSLPPPPPRRSG